MMMCEPARSYQLGPSKLIIFCTLTERAAGPHASIIYLIQGKKQYAIYFKKTMRVE